MSEGSAGISTVRRLSHWLNDALAGSELTPQASLEGDHRHDIAVVGGGYVGLWTAIQLKHRDPACDVAVLERAICGSGASGRNAGDVVSWAYRAPNLAAQFGELVARDLIEQSEQAQGEILDLALTHGIDLQTNHSGWLWAATGASQLNAWDQAMSLCSRLDVGSFDELPVDEVQRRLGTNRVLGGVLDRSTYTIQPARLALGLRDIALSLGVTIFEGSEVRSIRRAQGGVILNSRRGRLSAQRVVIAANAWAARFPSMSRSLAIISAETFVTEPARQRLDAAGVVDGETVLDASVQGLYFRRTPDHRLLLGRAGVRVASPVSTRGLGFDGPSAATQLLRRDLERLFPALQGISVQHSWGGPLDMSKTGLPIIGPVDKRDDILAGVGWCGNGVGPSVLGGKILASLALSRDDDWSASPLVGTAESWPPQPLRSVGARAVKRALLRAERDRDRGQRPGAVVQAIANRLPPGLQH